MGGSGGDCKSYRANMLEVIMMCTYWGLGVRVRLIYLLGTDFGVPILIGLSGLASGLGGKDHVR